MTTKNMVAKNMFMSVLLGLMLGSSLVQASKQAVSPSHAAPSGSCYREGVLAEEDTEMAAATEDLFAALFPTFALQQEGEFEEGSYFFQCAADRVALADETISLVCEQARVVCTAEIVSEIQEVVQAVVKKLLAMPEGWEVGVKSRRMAYDCAQRYLSSRELEVKLVFAALVDYLSSHFLSVMAWYGFNDDEKELARTHMPYAAFYEWEVALPYHVPTDVTDEQREMYLLAPTGNMCEDVLTDCILFEQTRNDWGILSPERKDVLRVLIHRNRKYGESDQQVIRRLFLESTELLLSHCRLDKTNVAFLSSLGEFLAGMQHLTKLNLFGNSLGELDAERLRMIMNGLASMQHLTELNFSSGTLVYLFDAERLNIVMDGLKKIQHLTKLILSCNSLHQLDAERLRIVMDGLVRIQHLTKLNLFGNGLEELDAERLGIMRDGLARMQHLTALNLSSNDLGQLDADRLKMVMDGLAGMQHLTTLNLSNNGLSDAVIQQLRERLSRTTIIERE